MDTQLTEKGFERVWQMFQETDTKFKETDKMFKETNKKFKETADQIKETDKKVNKLTGKWGRFVEGLIVPAAERMFKERKIEVDTVYQRVKKHKNGDEIEIDILALNGDYAVLIEAKSTLGLDDIKDHIESLCKFKSFFPEYADRKVIGAVAGIVIDEGSDRFAYKRGLFVIAQTGDTVRILNDKSFMPKEW